MRRVGKDRKCEICGFIARPGGIGSHMRLKHGIKVKILVKQLSHISGQLSEISGQSSEISHLSDLSERVQRPSDFVRKRSEKVEGKFIEPDWEMVMDGWGKKCNKCEWYIPKPEKDNDCPMGGKHDFLRWYTGP